MKTIFGTLLALSLISGCSTTTSRNVAVERADGLSHAPDWASVTQATYDSEGKRFFLGYVEVDGDSSKSAALNMSDEKALSEPMRSLLDQFLDQNQVGEDLSASTGQRIISSTRGYRPPMSGLRIIKRYWEVIESGPNKSQLRVYSLAEVPLSEFENAQRAYTKRLNGNSEVRKILSEVGAKQRDAVLADQTER